MQFEVRTSVAAPLEEVFEVFGDRAFVESVAPRWLRLEVLAIGLALQDRIHVRMRRLPRSDWISEITSLKRTPEEIWFVDTSVQAPFGLGSFVHHHGFIARAGGTVIVDSPRFQMARSWLTPVAYPLLYASFLMRRRPYRRQFGRA